MEQAPGPARQRPLPDARRALHGTQDRGGAPADSGVQPYPRRSSERAGQIHTGNTKGAATVSPWERRERGGLYYTRSRKVNGQVVRKYVGGGVLGQLAARVDADERCRREEEAALWREERQSPVA